MQVIYRYYALIDPFGLVYINFDGSECKVGYIAFFNRTGNTYAPVS